jgi:K+-transporting ATPase KdpF subunit
MNLEAILVLILSLAVLAYLTYTLIRPEKF